MSVNRTIGHLVTIYILILKMPKKEVGGGGPVGRGGGGGRVGGGGGGGVDCEPEIEVIVKIPKNVGGGVWSRGGGGGGGGGM